jgi:hypothetical protein
MTVLSRHVQELFRVIIFLITLGKVIFEISHVETEKFQVKGKIKGIPAFQRNFDLQLGDLLTAKENDQEVFDTEKGLELHVNSTLFFLNQNFYKEKK